jgi:hypothetical protein
MTPPDTVQIKTILRDAVSHGTMQKMANILGVSHSEISRRFDPNQEKRAYIAESARELWGLACTDPEAYQIVKTYFVMLLESWAEPVPTSDKSLSGLVGEAAQKLNDLQKARFIDGRSETIQREETLAIISALQQFLTGLGKQLELKGSFPKRAAG